MTSPTFVFDGDCAFCSSCARFIERRITTRAAVVAWQRTDLDALGLSEAQCEQAVQWVGTDGTHGSGVEALGRLLVDAGSFWRPLGRLLLMPPLSWLGPPVYRLISRHRDKLPGGAKACALPQAQRRLDRPDIER